MKHIVFIGMLTLAAAGAAWGMYCGDRELAVLLALPGIVGALECTWRFGE